MKTKIYTLIIFFATIILANKLSAQTVAEGSSFNTTTEMDAMNTIPALSNFFADIRDNAVKVSWVVKNEPLNSVYYIEKSTDEINYVVIAIIDAKYSNSKVNEYSFIDKEVSDKTVYYSVRQESRKGTLYSKLLTVEKVKVETPVE